MAISPPRTPPQGIPPLILGGKISPEPILKKFIFLRTD